ncbi:sortase [Paraclostridium bifermentans]|jgi:sortase A|uniref:class D sortase n=1 Tax=Paraclostridium bifermentans TaxID=1490 RepID=UPI000DF75192|nr:class D sortase [Paraclostridium bifermentans]MBS5953932.1 class D sortase [Paraclostridium bifermentans]MBU5289404.1 class D sortase [Paraclostridium bifermentans]RDC49910.1 class D sortase [Acinetobacter sp. RIT592]
MKRIFGKLLIAFGACVICGVLYLNYTTSKINNKMVEDYKETIITSDIKNDEYNLGDVIGVLNIPKIDLEVAIKRGIDNEILKDAVGHFENTSMAGEYGNFAVAGHRAYTSNKFFSNLDELQVGDEINVLSGNEEFKYKVNNIEVVTPDKVDVVDSTDKNKKEITLVTCTPKYIGSHRLIVKGEYIK